MAKGGREGRGEGGWRGKGGGGGGKAGGEWGKEKWGKGGGRGTGGGRGEGPRPSSPPGLLSNPLAPPGHPRCAKAPEKGGLDPRGVGQRLPSLWGNAHRPMKLSSHIS